MGAIMSFITALVDWLNLPVSMPFPHNFAKIFFPKYHNPITRFTGNKRERKIYADVPYKEGDANDTAKDDRLFHPHTHRKYNARLCFINQKEEEKVIKKNTNEVQKKIEELKSLPENAAIKEKLEELKKLEDKFKQQETDLKERCEEDPKMQDPYSNGDDTRQGYDDFLRSLEVIGMQEYIKREHTGEGLSDEAQKALLKRLNQEEDWKKKGSDQTEIKKEDLHDLARWERFIQLRDYAEIRNKWFQNMYHRSQCSTKMQSDLDIDKCKDHPKPNGRMYPGIRRKTFWLLTRPIEPDWNLLTVFGYILAISTYIFSVYTQIYSLATTCAGPYICPLAHIVDSNPLIAPPLSFRQTSDEPYFHTDRWRYYPRAIQSCTLGAPGCTEPGYRVQWPFMQTDEADLTVTGFPASLAGRCPVVEAGEQGYSWDPFQQTLRGDYYDCEAEEGCAGKPCSLPFTAAGPGGQTAAFYMDVKWYAENRRATVACMEALIEDGVIDSKPEALTLIGSTSKQARSFLRRMDQCVSSDRSLSNLAKACGCVEGENEWPVALYHDQDPVRTCKTDVPFVSGTVCELAEDCDDNAECTRVWDDSKPISATDTYGCFFRSPTADEPVPADYFTCGFSVEQQIIRSTTAQPLLSRRQIALEVDVAKKTGFITAFMIKEGGAITAWVLTGVLITMLGLFLLIPAIIVIAISVVWMSSMGDRLENVKNINTVFIYVQEGAVFVLHVIFSLLMNMSTTYRTYKLLRSIASGQTNASLEDLNRKITNLVNILLNLAILVFSDVEIYNNSLLIASIALSFILVLFQMQLEKESLEAIASSLKDMNENRLSKFEIALVIHKLMEDFLSQDVQFLWTKHLVSNEPLIVDELKEFEGTEKKGGGGGKELGSFEGGKDLADKAARQHKKTFNDEIDKVRWTYLFCPPTAAVQENGEAREMDIFQSFPLLPKDLAAKYGHDGRYEFLEGADGVIQPTRKNDEYKPAKDSKLIKDVREESKTRGISIANLRQRGVATQPEAATPAAAAASPRAPASRTAGPPAPAAAAAALAPPRGGSQGLASSASSAQWGPGSPAQQGGGAFNGMGMGMAGRGMMPQMPMGAHGQYAMPQQGFPGNMQQANTYANMAYMQQGQTPFRL